jgi:hypothetical protein
MSGHHAAQEGKMEGPGMEAAAVKADAAPALEAKEKW